MLIDPAAGNARTLVTKLGTSSAKFETLLHTLEVIAETPDGADEQIAVTVINQANALSEEINAFIDQVF